MLDIDLGFESFTGLREQLFEVHPELKLRDHVISSDISALKALIGTQECGKGSFKVSERPYFLDNPILRASKIMADCAAMHSGK